jgi:hypothetical protein
VKLLLIGFTRGVCIMYMEEFMQRPVDRHTYYVAWKSMAPRKTSVAAAKPIIDRPLTRTIMEMYCPLNGQKLLRIGTNQKVEHVFWCKRTDTAYSVPREQSIGLDVMPNSLEQRKPSESRPDRCRSRQVNFNSLMTTSSVVSVARVCHAPERGQRPGKRRDRAGDQPPLKNTQALGNLWTNERACVLLI